MPRFKISPGTAKGKAWKATGVVNGKKKTIQGGQKGAKVRPGTPKAKSFLARHGAPKTAKQVINERIWKGKAKIGSTVNIPSKFFS